jgi:anti-sigma B factor antagonist
MALTVREIPVPSEPAAALLEITGAIDPHGLEPLERALETLRGRGKRHVVLDLAGIRYVNSSGFGILVKHATALEAEGGGLSLLGVPRKVSIVIELLGLEASFPAVCNLRRRAFAPG